MAQNSINYVYLLKFWRLSMNSLVKYVDKDIEEYETLLLKKESVIKKGKSIYIEYMKLYGGYIVDTFKLKVECIKLKKMISICNRYKNKGEKIYLSKVFDEIEGEMEEYQDELNNLINTKKICDKAELVKESDSLLCKTVYRHIMKLIHPDMNKELYKHKAIKDAYQEAVNAYHDSNLKRLKEIEEFVISFVNKNGLGKLEIKIDDISSKIKNLKNEISELIKSHPYCLNLTMINKKTIELEKAELQQELDTYKIYKTELESAFAKFDIIRGDC